MSFPLPGALAGRGSRSGGACRALGRWFAEACASRQPAARCRRIFSRYL